MERVSTAVKTLVESACGVPQHLKNEEKYSQDDSDYYIFKCWVFTPPLRFYISHRSPSAGNSKGFARSAYPLL
jgi:hypothetical protein